MNDSIIELCRGIAELKKQAKALGMFTDDRELLECEECGLYEDVTSKGLLITEFRDSCGKDTGLRFIETEESNIFYLSEMREENRSRERRLI